MNKKKVFVILGILLQVIYFFVLMLRAKGIVMWDADLLMVPLIVELFVILLIVMIVPFILFFHK